MVPCGAQAGIAAPILPIIAPAVTNTKLVHDWIQCSNAPGTPGEKALTAVLVFATSGMITKTGDMPANMGAAACIVAFVTYMQQAVNIAPTPFLMAKSVNRMHLSFKQIIMIHVGFTLVVLMVIGSTIFVVQYCRNLYRILKGLPENSTKLFNKTKTIPKKSKQFFKKTNKFLKKSINTITSTTRRVKSTYNFVVNCPVA